MSEAAAGMQGSGSDGFMTRVDGYQQRHAWLALPFAVYRKFSDD